MRRRRRKKTLTKKKIFKTLSLLLIVGLGYLCTKIDWTTPDYDYFSNFPLPKDDYCELIYTPEVSTFSIWAPDAEEVRLLLYRDGEKGHAYKMFAMHQNRETGVWTVDIKQDLDGLFYAFNAKYDKLWRGDSPGLLASATGVNGRRGAVLNPNNINPKDWNSDKNIELVAETDAILYALHVHEFSIGDRSIDASLRGRFLGIVQEDTLATDSTTTLRHLKNLGVTHVRLMPPADFMGIDETNLDKVEEHNWGFNTLNYNVPEGSYSTNPYAPEKRILEFKEMVQQLHKSGIGVIIDVSYAIAYNVVQTNFERIVPGYFFYASDEKRKGYKEFDAGQYALALNRPFVQTFIEKSLKFWVEEYHVDGFSFQNIDLYRPEVLDEIIKKLKQQHPHLFVTGQYSDFATPKSASKLDSIPFLSGESMYFANKVTPDSIKLNSFLLRKKSNIEYLKLGIVGGVHHDSLDTSKLNEELIVYNAEPWQSVNKISSYRDEALIDFSMANTDDKEERDRLSKLAYTLLLTSQGIPEIYGGNEFLQSKNDTLVKQGKKTPRLDWKLKYRNSDFYNYVEKLIKLRKKHPAFRMNSKDSLNLNLEFLPTSNPSSVAYRLKDNANGDEWEDIIVVLNSSKSLTSLDIPEGRYIAVCRDGIIHEFGLNYVYGQLSVNPQSATIIYRSSKDVIAPPSNSGYQSSSPTKQKIVPKNQELINPLQFQFNFSPVKKEKDSVIKELNEIKIDN